MATEEKGRSVSAKGEGRRRECGNATNNAAIASSAFLFICSFPPIFFQMRCKVNSYIHNLMTNYITTTTGHYGNNNKILSNSVISTQEWSSLVIIGKVFVFFFQAAPESENVVVQKRIIIVHAESS